MSLPITFLSDFGTDDEFVGVVHGVLAKLAPESRTIDLTHGVPRGKVRAGALTLTRSIQYLPEGVCLAVVDPGVGADRKAIVVETAWGFLVGPDNGLLSPAAAMVGGATKIVSIENPEAMIPSPGQTFHGRDLFAPASALLASGEAALEDLGPVVDGDSLTPLLLPLPETEGDDVTGEAWWVDAFGNAQTNISPEELSLVGAGLGSVVSVRIGAITHELPWVTSYGDVAEGEALLHVDSTGLMAAAVRGGSASDVLSLGEGVTVTMSPRTTEATERSPQGR